MPNKQITAPDPEDALPPLVGGMDDTYNFWTQVDGGGPGSSFAASWAQLFIAKSNPAGDGTSLTIAAGDGAGGGSDGGDLMLYAGEGVASGGDAKLFAGNSTGYPGFARITAGSEGYVGGDVVITGGEGVAYGGNVRIVPGNGGTLSGWVQVEDRIVWANHTASAGDTYSGGLYVDGSNFVKRKP